jgi:TolB-like protein
MILSTNFFHKTLLAFLGTVLCAGCARTRDFVIPAQTHTSGIHRIAVFPIENLSGAKAPLKQLRQTLVEMVQRQGFDVVADAALDRFLARHRTRYVGGVDAETAMALAGEEQADAVLITSLEYLGVSNPPKIALTARLVTAGKEPEIIWMDSVGLSGNDSPGVFELGLIRDSRELTDKALRQITRSLSDGLSARMGENAVWKAKRRFSPKQFYRSDLAPDQQFRVVVLPFYNRSERKYAGEIMALHFIQELRKLGNFHIVEPGQVRHKLLQFRLIMEEGPSNANADIIYDTLGANLLVTGKVITYFDEQGQAGAPRVDFSAYILDKKHYLQVLASDSYNSGNDDVFFFDFGSINTAQGVALEMVRSITTRLSRPPEVSIDEGKKK